jgi:hypothetical protein
MNQFEAGAETGTAQAAGKSEGSALDQHVQEVAQRAQAVAADAADGAGVKLRSQMDQRSTQLGEQVVASAQAIRSGADELHRHGNQAAGDAAYRAATQAERLGEYLQASDANRILTDAENVARRNPWAVVAGGVIAGAAAARFLKASSSRRYQIGVRDTPTPSSQPWAEAQ